MIDWLGSAQHRAVGASLMRKVQEGVPTQFGLGGSKAGRAVIKRGGYEPREPVPVYQRVLRPSHWLRISELGPVARGSRFARDLARHFSQPLRSAQLRIELRRVSSFNGEIESITSEARKHAILTGRGTERLDYFLRFPRRAMSGWLLLTASEQLCGFALLNLVPQHQGRVRMGKIVDCLIGSTDVAVWHSAIQALARELAGQGADIAQSFASTPWMAESLQRSGFISRFALEFSVRDRQQSIPRGLPFHLMPMEADYAYT
jgi:hypothetical protein